METVHRLVASVHHLVRYCHHHQHLHQSIGLRIQTLLAWMLLWVTYRSPDSGDYLTSCKVRSHSGNETDHRCTSVQFFCWFIKHRFFPVVFCLLWLFFHHHEWIAIHRLDAIVTLHTCHLTSEYLSKEHLGQAYQVVRFTSYISPWKFKKELGVITRGVFVDRTVAICLVVFVSNHTALRILKCWHEYNKEEYSWSANQKGTADHIISKNFKKGVFHQ